MPDYEYQCMDCNMVFNIHMTIKEHDQDPELTCPHCGAKHVHKKISGFSAVTEKKS